jgi:hypothetical protein
MTKLTARVKSHDIECWKEGFDRNWYIKVRAPNGCLAYDGWWRDSESKTPGQALDEAIHGACINHHGIEEGAKHG